MNSFDNIYYDSKPGDYHILDQNYNNNNSISMSSSTTSSSSSVYLSPLLTKPASAVAIGAALHKNFIAPEGSDWMNSGKFGLALGAGFLFSGAFIQPYVTSGLPNSSLYNGTTLADRILEVSLSSAAAFGAMKMSGADLVNANYSSVSADTGKAILVVAGTSFLSTYVADYFASAPLSYLGSSDMPAAY